MDLGIDAFVSSNIAQGLQHCTPSKRLINVCFQIDLLLTLFSCRVARFDELPAQNHPIQYQQFLQHQHFKKQQFNQLQQFKLNQFLQQQQFQFEQFVEQQQFHQQQPNIGSSLHTAKRLINVCFQIDLFLKHHLECRIDQFDNLLSIESNQVASQHTPQK